MGESAKWYVVQAQANAETRAVINLERQGFQTYLPRYLKRRRHARRVDTVTAPLFPRYLFVSINLAVQRWLSIHSTLGIARLLCNGGMPALVSDEMIEILKREEDDRGFIELASRSQFQRGDKIRVDDGTFCGSLGLFETSTDDERVTVFLDFLGRKVRVILDWDLIAAA
jgi:transcriptional antiterminator RfaH